MDPLSIRVEALLARAAPEVTLFDLQQSQTEREAAIRGLAADESAAVLDILVREILGSYDLRAEEQNLEYLMPASVSLRPDEDEVRAFSDDWRLCVFRDAAGMLVEFNGWPGDSESGGGVFYAADGAAGVPIFSISNGFLEPAAGREDCAKAIEDYMEHRRHGRL